MTSQRGAGRARGASLLPNEQAITDFDQQFRQGENEKPLWKDTSVATFGCGTFCLRVLLKQEVLGKSLRGASVDVEEVVGQLLYV